MVLNIGSLEEVYCLNYYSGFRELGRNSTAKVRKEKRAGRRMQSIKAELKEWEKKRLEKQDTERTGHRAEVV